MVGSTAWPFLVSQSPTPPASPAWSPWRAEPRRSPILRLLADPLGRGGAFKVPPRTACWRREWDSNPRGLADPLEPQASPFGRSGIPPPGPRIRAGYDSDGDPIGHPRFS